MTEIETIKKIPIEKDFNEYPDPFEEIKKLEKEEYVGLLVATNQYYIRTIRVEQVREVNCPEFMHIMERIKAYNNSGQYYEFGVYNNLGGIAVGLLSSLRYLINERNKMNNIFMSNNVMVKLVGRYLNTNFYHIMSKFFS